MCFYEILMNESDYLITMQGDMERMRGYGGMEVDVSER